MSQLLLGLLIATLTACAPGGGTATNEASAPPAAPPPLPRIENPFAGQPASFDGTWVGVGRASTEHWEQASLNFRVHIGKTPGDVDVTYDIRYADGSSFSMGSFTGQYAVGNQLFAPDTRTVIGAIGAGGFQFTRAGLGAFSAVALDDQHLDVHGYLEYGSSKITFDATLSL